MARFGMLSALCVLALGLVVGTILQRTIRDRTLSDAERSATVVANVGITPFLTPEDLQRGFVPLDDDRLAELDRTLRSGLSDNGFVRMKVWNREHWIVYSDNPRLIGRWFAGDSALESSFAGEGTSEITSLDSAEEFEERSFGELLAVYVPLRAGTDGVFSADPAAPVVGSFEIYLPYRPIAAAIDRETRRLWLVLGTGLLVVWLVLYRLVASASRRLRRQAADNEHLALHDTLTGLANRVLFARRFTTAIAEARAQQRHVAVLLLDLDRFKEVNDTLGHHHGDELLRQLGPRLVAALAPGQTVARLGGDEFAVLVPDLTDPDEATALARRLLEDLERPFAIDGLELDVRGSVGVASYPRHGQDPDTLLQRADVAMYRAKAAHAGVEVYDPAHDPYSARRLALAAEVRRAIDRHELVLHYQPKLDLTSMRIHSVEALLRWDHPEQGLVGPNEFLPVIENTELIRPLTLYVLDRALEQVVAWRADGMDLQVSVNLPAVCAQDRALPARVAASLAQHGLPARCLALELTESSLLVDPVRAAEVLGELDALGVRLSVDDFGTGYASVTHLKQLPVSELKIDRSFVARLAEQGQDAVIVQFSIDLARTLGISVVAEGVEDEQVLDRLAELGCDEVQGYFVSRPLPPDRLRDLVRDFDDNVGPESLTAGARDQESLPPTHPQLSVGVAP